MNGLRVRGRYLDEIFTGTICGRDGTGYVVRFDDPINIMGERIERASVSNDERFGCSIHAIGGL